jgi:ribosomal protein S18 acetylase RimI-like enzyme
MTITIDQANVTDCASVVRLIMAQLREHEQVVSPETLARSCERILKDSAQGRFFLARDAHVAVGVAFLSFAWPLEVCDKVGWLEELYVVPEYRDRGIGRSLVVRVEEDARAEGCATLDLEVQASHQRAANLYNRLGFVDRKRQHWTKQIAHHQG